MHQRRASGFTMVELMVAVALGGTVLLLIHEILDTVTRTARELQAMRVAEDQEFNGRRWIRAALGSIHPATEHEPFEGRPASLSFTASVRRGEGWFERERVTVEVRDGQFIAAIGSGVTLRLADSVAAVAFDYLLEASETTRWVREWVSAARSPVALRMRVLSYHPDALSKVDTALFLVRDRR